VTCVAVPWVPTEDAESARLIQQIVLDEEADVRADGRVMSHFVGYLEAIDEIGADSGPARALVRALADGSPFAEAVQRSDLPPAARAFGRTTAKLLERPLHARAAAFFHGREEILPAMFLAVLKRLEDQGLPCPALREYLHATSMSTRGNTDRRRSGCGCSSGATATVEAAAYGEVD
jgi:hypothetical protein